MLGGLRVKGNIGRAGLGKLGDDTVHGLDHQVYVQGCGDAVIAQGLDHDRPKRQVRDIVIIHHIDMDKIGAGLQHGGRVLAQAGQVGR